MCIRDSSSRTAGLSHVFTTLFNYEGSDIYYVDKNAIKLSGKRVIASDGSKKHMNDLTLYELNQYCLLYTSYGDALMAMIGANHINNFTEAKKLIDIGKVYYPNLENTLKYESYYKMYIELYKQNKKLMAMMDKINQ